MIERSFVDTNVWVYRVDRGEPLKRDVARRLLDDAPSGSLVISTQVLQEFYSVTTRRLATPLSENEAAAAVERLSDLLVVGSDSAFVRQAIGISRSSRISLWDALIVQAALAGGCDRILTEDLQHGSVIQGMPVVDPFALA
ncbi:MAG: PIN domain-containing protein [Egibacteraceae bacterium]